MKPTRIKSRSLAFFVSAALLAMAATPAVASSHREAPFIAGQPKVDGTDFYMFRSYEDTSKDSVTFLADYIPLQDPQGGPNFNELDANAETCTSELRHTQGCNHACVMSQGIAQIDRRCHSPEEHRV